jgi:hypothetical protein
MGGEGHMWRQEASGYDEEQGLSTRRVVVLTTTTTTTTAGGGPVAAHAVSSRDKQQKVVSFNANVSRQTLGTAAINVGLYSSKAPQGEARSEDRDLGHA